MSRDRKGLSVTAKITCIMISLVAGVILLCLLLNNTLLESYYIREKQTSLKTVFAKVAASVSAGGLYQADGVPNPNPPSEAGIEIEKVCEQYSVSLAVLDADAQILYYAGGNEGPIGLNLWGMLAGMPSPEQAGKSNGGGGVMLRYADRRLHTEYLALWGSLPDGNTVLMRTAIESVKESVKLSNRFLLYVGIAGILLAATVSYFVTRSITKLIRKMTEMEADIEKKIQIDEMRREFLGNVSHELKTPIALIQGYAEGLREGVNEDEQSRAFYCEVIQDEAEKMNRMVQQLLSLNQLECGNEEPAMERFNLTELIAGVVQSNFILCKQKQIRLVFEETEPIYVRADEFKAEEVLSNYMSNAIHYAGGEKCVRVLTKRREGLIRVSVYNTGELIPQDELDEIWVKFYKVDKARTREYGGSGIGLSIVKAIMDSFGQDCGVNNHEHEVEFWFELACDTGEDFHEKNFCL